MRGVQIPSSVFSRVWRVVICMQKRQGTLKNAKNLKISKLHPEMRKLKTVLQKSEYAILQHIQYVYISKSRAIKNTFLQRLIKFYAVILSQIISIKLILRY